MSHVRKDRVTDLYGPKLRARAFSGNAETEAFRTSFGVGHLKIEEARLTSTALHQVVHVFLSEKKERLVSCWPLSWLYSNKAKLALQEQGALHVYLSRRLP